MRVIDVITIDIKRKKNIKREKKNKSIWDSKIISTLASVHYRYAAIYVFTIVSGDIHIDNDPYRIARLVHERKMHFRRTK